MKCIAPPRPATHGKYKNVVRRHLFSVRKTLQSNLYFFYFNIYIQKCHTPYSDAQVNSGRARQSLSLTSTRKPGGSFSSINTLTVKRTRGLHVVRFGRGARAAPGKVHGIECDVAFFFFSLVEDGRQGCVNLSVSAYQTHRARSAFICSRAGLRQRYQSLFTNFDGVDVFCLTLYTVQSHHSW